MDSLLIDRGNQVDVKILLSIPLNGFQIVLILFVVLSFLPLPFNSIEWIHAMWCMLRDSIRELSIPLNGFHLSILAELGVDLVSAFNSIEWIQELYRMGILVEAKP